MAASPTGIELTETERSVLSVVYAKGECTRPDISASLDVSKPTVSLAVSALENAGLIAPVRARQGSLGRSATVYAIAASAGWLLGLDIGSTRVKVLSRGLDGRELKSVSKSLSGPGTRNEQILKLIGSLVAGMIDEIAPVAGPLRAVGVAVPRVISQYLNEESTSRTVGRPALAEILAALDLNADVPVLLENNVNCAALAEMELGSAQDVNDFVFLQVGVGIGSGIVADRRVLRGARGGAGEVSSLPTGWPAHTAKADRFALEDYLGANQFLDRWTSTWDVRQGPVPTTVAELFDSAAAGVPTAVAALDQHSRDIGQLVLSLAAVLDPALILLGGGVGQNPHLLEGVRAVVQRIKPEVQVTAGSLGEDATVEGAVALTLDHALSGLLGSRYKRRLDDRTTVVFGTQSPADTVTYADRSRSARGLTSV
ncbi:ROK family protein [Arthrobacter sp. ISL-95]|uniref:ROK family transcriptional regulator n=1 Tax=Arthrobacter sp. ISL-95 TaxID=2819116 RepID=UPI001BECB2F0|nr:ROK family protein [Arthrobacter sp. ISL-95]MBT2588501.1 ROK family protein [Arthrobacter sp. ISL-95]